MLDPNEFEEFQRFRSAWEAVRIERSSPYSLFTFGHSELPYFLVTAPRRAGSQVAITRGEVRITRPMIITPDNIAPEFQNFFEDDDEEGAVRRFIMARSAAFSHMRFVNRQGEPQIVTDSVEEAVARLTRQLDDTEEDRVAILTAPSELAGFAIFRYAAERVMQSAPDNIQELRERGFLP